MEGVRFRDRIMKEDKGRNRSTPMFECTLLGFSHWAGKIWLWSWRANVYCKQNSDFWTYSVYSESGILMKSLRIQTFPSIKWSSYPLKLQMAALILPYQPWHLTGWKMLTTNPGNPSREEGNRRHNEKSLGENSLPSLLGIEEGTIDGMIGSVSQGGSPLNASHHSKFYLPSNSLPSRNTHQYTPWPGGPGDNKSPVKIEAPIEDLLHGIFWGWDPSMIYTITDF